MHLIFFCLEQGDVNYYAEELLVQIKLLQKHVAITGIVGSLLDIIESIFVCKDS